ncbi:helix-turn-helix domain-containing protein [Amycolatopsis rhizosphaerae]|uniref:Helix-turn-helix domain-containing protein n=1 Tax=Amycolatopsis rhizosphaerae TaxID=2053003 RepID=A0A558CBR7_9PSEU|nr:helix-turn-helix domain-containing protein [Amycolatopsis rhizosphaerae]TVT46229.1 helix-turn-helix domain-containing protein [Amycolatopsis rhizosphaerae]
MTSRVETADSAIERFAETASGVCAPLRVVPAGRSRFTGGFSGGRIGGVVIARATCSPCTVLRSERVIRSTDRELVKVILNGRGTAGVEQNGQQSLLRPGDLVTYETVRPYEVHFWDAADTVVIGIPRDELGPHAELLTRRTVVPVSAGTGLRSALLRFVRDLTEAPALPANEHLGNALVSLVLAEFTHDAAPAASPESLADRILAHCLAHLSDPGLSVERVAAAHGISVRYLHKILEPKGVTLWAWIRRRRLERIRDDLADPAFAHRTVSAIATRWGLPDAAHLGRALKTEFGRTAAQLRGRAR